MPGLLSAQDTQATPTAQMLLAQLLEPLLILKHRYYLPKAQTLITFNYNLPLPHSRPS